MASSDESAQIGENRPLPDQPEDSGVVVRMWARRPVCGPRTRVIDRLGTLRTDGAIEDFEIETWPDELVVGERDQQILTLVETLQQWALDADVTLQPAFDRRTVSPLVGASHDVLTLPMMALAVYDDGDLRGVYPCSKGTRTWTVASYLSAVENDQSPPHEQFGDEADS